MRVLVTGAAGFIGSALSRGLTDAGHQVRACVRDRAATHAGLPEPIEIAAGSSLDGPEAVDWRARCDGFPVIVHAAARAHVLDERAGDPAAEFARVNTEATLRLAGQAAQVGLRHLIFLSSIGVVAARSDGAPLAETRAVAPCSPYARSKLLAEVGLARLASERGFALTVLRLPLVHGPRPKGNLARLMAAVRARRWLPVGLIRNRRSLLGLDNLCDAVLRVVEGGGSGTALYHLADDGVISTSELVSVLAAGLGQRSRQLPVPAALLRLAAAVTGRAGTVAKVIDDLEVDSGGFRRAFAWCPPRSLREGLLAMASSDSAESAP